MQGSGGVTVDLITEMLHKMVSCAAMGSFDLMFEERGSGAPVVFVHAFPLNSAMWEPQVATLSTRCRTVTIDLRGFGASPPLDGPYSMSHMASDVMGLIKHLVLDKPIIVGLSMGGYIALAFCSLFPEALAGLVLADTRADTDADEARERRLRSASWAETQGIDSLIEDAIPVLLGERSRAANPGLIQQVRRIAKKTSPSGYANAQRAMAERQDSTPFLVNINCPVLVITGQDDVLTPPSVGEEMSRRFPDSRFELIEGAGHLSNLERPDQFNAALWSFISAIELTRSL